MKICSFQECGRPHAARGLCDTHWRQQRSGKPLAPIAVRQPRKPCAYELCDRLSDTRGYCGGHAMQLKEGRTLAPLRSRAGGPCKVLDCRRPVYGWGLCNAHYKQQRTVGGTGPIAKRRTAAQIAEIAARGELICDDCDRSLPLIEFRVRGANGSRRRCAACQSARGRAQRFGTTADFLAALLAAQGNRCALCQSEDPGGKKGWHVDHDHSCCPAKARGCGGCIRGLLCNGCNARGLPWYESLPLEMQTIDRINVYLAAPPARVLLS